MRRRRLAPMWAGCAALATGLGCAGTVAWNWACGFDWLPYEPTWYVTRDATSRRDATDELFRRLDAGKLDEPQTNSIVERLLSRQTTAPPQLWLTRWGDFVERAAVRSHVRQDLLVRYAMQGGKPQLLARANVAAGDGVPWRVCVPDVRLSSAEAGGTPALLMMEYAVKRLSVDDVAIDVEPSQVRWLRGTPGTIQSIDGVVPTTRGECMVAGQHTIAVTIELSYWLRTATELPQGASRLSSAPLNGLLCRRSVQLTSPWCRQGWGKTSVVQTSDPTLRERMRGSMTASAKRDGGTLQLTMRSQRPPMAASFRIEVKGKSGTWRADRAWLVRVRPDQTERFDIPAPAMADDEVDVVLRPDPIAAANTVDIDQICGDDLVIRQVGVTSER